MEFKISLCIPTYRRYEKFLKKNIELYLKNPYIDEIIISDETGEDIEIIKEQYKEEAKLKLFKNENILGAFLNKKKSVSFANNEWICLIDSDNYAPISYFESWLEYIKINGIDNKYVYLPIGSIPQSNHPGFNYEMFNNIKINKRNICSLEINGITECLLNTGNYIVNKNNYLETANNFLNELHTECYALDVLFKNALLLLNDSTLVIVPNMKYHHIVHDGSYFIEKQNTYERIRNTLVYVYNNLFKFYNINYIMSLKKWQNKIKQTNELLYNCSEFEKENDEWVKFPIGMGWSFINYNKNNFVGEHSKLVLCAINPTTDQIRRPYMTNRKKILNTLEKNNIKNVYLHSTEYFDILSDYKFIISPEGNGIDCHRHYEALIYGCIPIVEDNPLTREKYNNLPILFTNDYSEITEKYLTEMYDEMLNREYVFTKLFLNNYNEEEQNQIKNNGNYWSQKLSGKKWYNV